MTILSSAESPVTDLAARYLSQAQLAELTRPVMERATTLVNGLRNDFIKDGYPVITKVHMGHVIDTIVKHVEAAHDHLLVIGSRGLQKPNGSTSGACPKACSNRALLHPDRARRPCLNSGSTTSTASPLKTC